jgi:hypothetical protein
MVVSASAALDEPPHRRLSRLAVQWAAAHRLTHCAMEVRLPQSGYRADVAATTPRVLSPHAMTAVFECKVSRSDFLKDAAPEAKLIPLVTELHSRLTALREMIGTHRPDLRLGDELFPQFEAVDLRHTKHETHDALTRQLRVAQNKLWGGTKFAKIARWRSANLLYLVCEEGISEPSEIPDGWGLLIRCGEELHLRHKPCLHEITLEQRVQLLERIAATASGQTRKKLGITLWDSRSAQ